MAKQPYIPGLRRPQAAGTLGRTEPVIEDERPLAEMRKSVHDALRILSLHRWAFFVPFSLIASAVFAASLYFPRTYRATTSFERRNDPVTMNLPLSSGAASFNHFRDTMVQDLTSVECIAESVDALGMTNDLARDGFGSFTERAQQQRNSLARALAATLGVTTSSPSEHIDIITITYTGPDPTIGRALVDEVKRTYIRRTMAWIHEFLTGQREYFQREADEALEDVKSAQREETRLRLENPHVDPTNPGAIASKLSQLELERRELELRRREYTAEQSALQQLLAATEPLLALDSVSSTPGEPSPKPKYLSPQALELNSQKRAIELQIEKLKSSRGMTDRHPDVRELLAQREQVASELVSQQERDRRASVSNAPIDAESLTIPLVSSASSDPIQSERARLLVQMAAQKSKLKDVEISLESNELAVTELNTAKREVYQKQEEFAEIMGRVAQARQRHEQLQTTLASIDPAIKAIEQDRLLQFSEGQPARGSSIPISPKASAIILLAVLAGLVAGAVFVVIVEVFDNIIRSSAQAAKALGLPMLEAIDEIVTAQDRRSLFLRRVVVTPLLVACLAVLTSLAGSMAYLSIERPWAYQRIRGLPDAAINLLAGHTGEQNVG